MRPTRLLLTALLAGALAPGTWLRTPEPPRDFRRLVAIDALAFSPARVGSFELVAAWQLTGDRVQFGGFSALVALDDERFLAGSDTGRRLLFARPDRGRQPGRLGSFFDEGDKSSKMGRDLESLAIDSANGTVWGGYEFRQSIVRFNDNYLPEAEARPKAMRSWEDNSGPEALVRLADGRFLVIEERPRKWRGHHHAALIFARDPITDARPMSLVIDIPPGYRPADATPLDDGRALILLRSVAWGIPPRFETALALLDVDRRNEYGIAQASLLAEFGAAIPQDNYEGLAITEDADGRHVWLISDDNFMSFQRTLLLKLAWRQREKARE